MRDHFKEAYYKGKIDKYLCKRSSVDRNIAVRCSNLDFSFIHFKNGFLTNRLLYNKKKKRDFLLILSYTLNY